MQWLKNTCPFGPVNIPAIRRIVPAGEVFAAPDDVAEELLAQVGNFEPAEPPAPAEQDSTDPAEEV